MLRNTHVYLYITFKDEILQLKLLKIIPFSIGILFKTPTHMLHVLVGLHKPAPLDRIEAWLIATKYSQEKNT